MGNKTLVFFKQFEGGESVKKYIILAFGVIALIMTILNYGIDNSIHLEKIKEVETDQIFKGDYWHMVDENRTEYLAFYNISPQEFNLNDYNIIISEGREIKEMTYKRERAFPFKQTKYANTILKNELYPNKVFIYKISKTIKVYLDERGNNLDIKIAE